MKTRGVVFPLLLCSCIEQSPQQVLPTSCEQILAEDPDATDDYYALVERTADGTVSRRVYCDMTTAGGGWTLVGRSAVDGVMYGGEFGWTTASGFVTDEGEAYALDATGLAFTEILVGSRVADNVWGAAVYRMEVPANFMSAYRDEAYPFLAFETVIGGCELGGQTNMLGWAGYTSESSHFFFKDQPGVVNFGLFPGGFNLSGSSCERSGTLHDEQGMVFVR